MAISESQIRVREKRAPPIRRHRLGFDHDVLELRAIGTRVHAKPAADRAGHAAQEFETRDLGVRRRARHHGIQRRRARADAVSFLDGDTVEPAAHPDHDARDAAVAHQKIGANADHRDGHVARLAREKMRQIVRVRRAEKHFRRPADAEPGEILQRRFRLILAAHMRQPVDEVTGLDGHHARPTFSAAS